MKTLVLSTTAILLFQSAKASFYGPKGVTSLTHHLAFNPPHRPKQTYNKKRSMTSTVNMDETTDQDDDTTATVPPLRYLGDEKLMQQQPPVTQDQLHSNEFQNNLKMLPKAMNKYGGIGIAAPQVGWWTRVFCFGIDGTNPRYSNAGNIPLTMWINPKISSPSKETNWMWEGCLSVPGMRGWVERPASIVLSGWDEMGAERKPQHLEGLAARIAQHEIHHLDGILFPQCVPDQNFLVPQASLEARDGWAQDWPSRGSYSTLMGELCDEK